MYWHTPHINVIFSTFPSMDGIEWYTNKQTFHSINNKIPNVIVISRPLSPGSDLFLLNKTKSEQKKKQLKKNIN